MKTTLRNVLKVASLIAILCSYAPAFAQLPVYDGINYTVAQALTAQTGWLTANSGDDVMITSGSLTYPGISSTGNKVSFEGAGAEAMRNFTAVNSGTVYYSFLLNVTSLASLNATGGYFTGLASNSTTFGATLWSRKDTDGYDLGFSARSSTGSPITWTEGTMSVGTTVFVVISYQFVPGSANDIVRLWINPTVAGSEGTPDITMVAATDLTSIDRIFLRQDATSATPHIEMDEFRVGTTWNHVNPAPEGTLAVSPDSLADFGTVMVGSSSESQSFEVTGSSLGNNDIEIVAPTHYQVSTDNDEWYPSVYVTPDNGDAAAMIYVRFSPLSAGQKEGEITISSATAGSQAVSVNGTGEAVADAQSDIIADPDFVYASNIDYLLYQGADVTPENSVALAGFIVRDGGTEWPDADTLPTELTSLSFQVANPGSLNRIALYVGDTELAEVDAAASISFNVPVTVADDETASLTLRATFKTTVTDNQQTSFTVTAATAAITGSTFTLVNAGGAISSTSGDINRIEVVATKLIFSVNASTAVINVAMNPSPEVRAVDNNNNRDLDYVGLITITSTGELAGDPVVVVPANGLATLSGLTHTAPGSGIQLNVSSGILAPVQSTAFDVFSPIFSNPITGTNPNGSNPYTAGQTTHPNITATGIGRGPGITGTNANNRYNANSWNTPAFDDTAYFEFTLEPLAGYMINLVNFSYTGQASGSGPTSFAFRSNAGGDNFTTNIGAAVASGATINLSDSQFQEITGPVTFRLYGWGASSATGTFSIDDFTFNGDVLENTEAVISASEIGGMMSYSPGNGPSPAYTTMVSAAYLDPTEGVLLVTAPANFEVSINNNNFSNSVEIPYSGGTVTSQAVYVRLMSGLVADYYSGEVTISGGLAADVSVEVQGTVAAPLPLSYSNTFRTLAEYNAASAEGFTFVDAPHNTSYIRIYPQGYVETPFIDFTVYSTIQLTFQAATFGGNTGQTLSLQISTDGGASYSTLGTYAPANGSTYIDYAATIDLSSYPSTNGKLRCMMTAGTNETRFRDLQILTFTTWNGTSWSAGEPDLDTAAVINGDYTGTELLEAFSLTVQSGNVIFESGSTLRSLNQLINNGGTITFANNANLIQDNPGANSGAIRVERETQIKRLDYVYWSSPVSGQQLQAFSPETLANRFYRLDEPTNTFVTVNPQTEFFGTGRGYMLRAPNTFTTTPQTFVGAFTGTPRNGNLTVAVTHNNAGYNLVGNPYPSPISASAFMAQNAAVGTLYFWTHSNQEGGGVNYATFNGTGAAAAAGGEAPNGLIQTGQGFMINTASGGNVVFNNSMRVDDHQNQFFRSQPEEQHRLWLRLSTIDKSFNQVLVGYVPGATNETDNEFDGKLYGNPETALYTTIESEAFVIQGRSLPFTETDEVSLGFRAAVAGVYSIALESFEGVFAEGQNVLVRDNLNMQVHSINESAYTFSSEAGNFADRFTLLFQNTTLGTTNPAAGADIVAYSKERNLHLASSGTVINSVEVFDLRGRKIYSQNNIDSMHFTLEGLSATNQLLLLHIKTGDHQIVIRKVSH